MDVLDIIRLPQRNGRRRKTRRGGAPPLPARSGQQYASALRKLEGIRQINRLPRNPRLRPRRRRGDSVIDSVGSTMGGSMPMMGGPQNARGMPKGIRKQRRTPFAEDEFIADFIGSTTFGAGASTNATQYAVNPGQAASFPWLSQLAPRFEKYVFTRLEFYYKHEVTQFIAAGTIGKALIAYDYDAADAPPTSKLQMLDMDPHSDGMPCEDFVMSVDCREAFNNGPKYVRPGNLPGGADIKTYDAGLLSIAGAGNSDGTTKIGELHVRYEGWFEKPVLESTTSAPANNQVAWFQSTTAESLATGVAYQVLLATASTNGLNAVNTAGAILLPAGNYLVDYVASFGFSVDFQSLNVSLVKNATNIFLSTAAIGVSGAGDLSASLSGGGYVTLNGTDTLALKSTAVFAAGTGVLGGSLRITAV